MPTTFLCLAKKKACPQDSHKNQLVSLETKRHNACFGATNTRPYLVDMKFDSAICPPYQQTLVQPVTLTDIGLHSGATVTMRLLPAPANSGITFIRTDLKDGENTISARWDHVVDTRLCTVIGNSFGARVSTVEHVTSALAGLGIDNCTIEIDGPEVPAMDGSAAPIVAAIEHMGIMPQSAPRRVLEILRPVEITEAGKSARFMPAATSDYKVTLDYTRTNALIGNQSAELRLTPTAYKREIAAARSFTLFAELDAVWSNGLGKGGSLDNNVLVWDTVVANLGGLRFDTEFARHKLLDAIGDLSLCGGAILGRFEGVATGHALNNKLLHAVFADTANYRWVDCGAPASTAQPELLRQTA